MPNCSVVYGDCVRRIHTLGEALLEFGDEPGPGDEIHDVSKHSLKYFLSFLRRSGRYTGILIMWAGGQERACAVRTSELSIGCARRLGTHTEAARTYKPVRD